MDDITSRLEQLKQAENNYYVTVKQLLEVTNKAYDLFMSSEVTNKRQVITLVLQNLRLKDENILWEAHEPFDMILKCNAD